MAIRYFSRNNTLNYTTGTSNGVLKKRNISTNSQAMNYKIDQTLQQVVSWPQKKIQQVKKSTYMPSYYIYGMNDIPLSAIYTLSGYNVVRTPSGSNCQIIDLYITTTPNFVQKSQFITDKVLYYTLMSCKKSLQVLAQTTETSYIIKPNMNGVIDYMILSSTTSDMTNATIVHDIQNKFTTNTNEIEFILPSANINIYYDIYIWRIDDFNSSIYKNVFTSQLFTPDKVEWRVYNNIEEYDLNLNYNFSLIGYTVQHNQPLSYSNLKFDYSDYNNLADIVTPASITGTTEPSSYSMNPNSYTLNYPYISNNKYSIERNYQYVLDTYDNKSDILTKKLRVFLPNYNNYNNLSEKCEKIYLYSSILSQTIYYNGTKTINITNITHIDNKLQLEIKHNLSGIVKCNIRNIANYLYDVILDTDNKTIYINFKYSYKVQPTSFYIDLFLVWSPDNNVI